MRRGVPVGVHSHIHKIFFSDGLVITRKLDAGDVRTCGSFRFPGGEPVEAHGWEADVAGLQVSADRRMVFSESDHIAEEIKQFPVPIPFQE